MQVEFECKERDCEEKVVYERKVVIALATARTPEAEAPKTRTVYLTCPLRHTHPYRVETS